MATVKKRGAYYEAHWYRWNPLAGRRELQRRSTHMERRETAQRQADAWERDDADPEASARAAETLGGCVARWLKTIQARVEGGQRAAGTLHCYRIKAGQLVRHFEHGGDAEAPRTPLPLAAVTRTRVDEYTAARRAERVTANTIHKELTVLRSALKHARAHGLFARDPAELLPHDFGPEYTPRERWLPEHELRALLDALTPGRAAAAAFIVATSAEWGCVERARRLDHDRARRSVHLRGTKADARRRSVPIRLLWQEQLLTFALAHADGTAGMMFAPWSNVRRDLAAACARASIAPCTPTDLRRTACHYLAHSGASERVAVAIMGHTSSAMVRRVYGRLGADEIAQHLEQLTKPGGGAPGATPPDFGPKGTSARANP